MTSNDLYDVEMTQLARASEIGLYLCIVVVLSGEYDVFAENMSSCLRYVCQSHVSDDIRALNLIR